jgi:hypothetical protein
MHKDIAHPRRELEPLGKPGVEQPRLAGKLECLTI